MGLFQNAIATYDAMIHSGKASINLKVPLAPIGHMTGKANIEITIDRQGRFVQASGIDEIILFPVTEKSSGRTSGIAAHPLCEQLGYLIPSNKEKYAAYTELLSEWCSSPYTHIKAEAVLQYVKSETIREDLQASGLIKADEDGILKNEKDFVCWRVLSGDGNDGPVWNDESLMQLFGQFYLAKMNKLSTELCMISGGFKAPALQHLKGVVPAAGNAKLISANDETNFTFLGRFIDKKEALTISYEASQKAHNALKWLVVNDGIRLGGGREMICWNPRGKRSPKPHIGLLRQREEKILPSEYRSTLNKIIYGYKKEYDFSDEVVLAVFDAATSGRLSVSYYNELGAEDFLDILKLWDETCCWYDKRFGTSSPSLFDIIQYSFGTLRNNRIEVDDRIQAQQMQRLLSCKIDRVMFPLDIMRSLILKCNNMQIYERNTRDQLLFITCAIVRKYKADHEKEEWNMALEPELQDRSYQYGRLLAVMEKVERDTYERDEKREPNAIRMQSVFVKRPAYAAAIIMNQLKMAYYPQLQPGVRVHYERLIGQIMEVISSCNHEENRELGETYLLGYYLQKNDMYKGKNTNSENEEMEE